MPLRGSPHFPQLVQVGLGLQRVSVGRFRQSGTTTIRTWPGSIQLSRVLCGMHFTL